LCISFLSHACYMPCPCHPSSLDLCNNYKDQYNYCICQRVQVTKVLNMQLSPTSCRFFSVGCRYSPQTPSSQISPVFPYCHIPSFTPTQNRQTTDKKLALDLKQRKVAGGPQFKYHLNWTPPM
jgi:hypothetical protein